MSQVVAHGVKTPLQTIGEAMRSARSESELEASITAPEMQQLLKSVKESDNGLYLALRHSYAYYLKNLRNGVFVAELRERAVKHNGFASAAVAPKPAKQGDLWQ